MKSDNKRVLDPQISFYYLADEIDNGGESSLSDRHLLGEFYTRCRIHGCTKTTLKYYRQNLGYLLLLARSKGKALVGIDRADIDHHIVSLMDRGLSLVSINTRLKAFKAFYNWAEKSELISDNPMGTVALIKVDKRVRPVLSSNQLELLLGSYHCKNFHSLRNYAMTLAAVDGMLRAGEICNLNIGHVFLGDRVLMVFGKSRRERHVSISPPTARLFQSYIMRFRNDIPGEAFFCKITGERLTPNRVYKHMARHSRKIGILYSPQMLRRTGATEWIKNGGSLAQVQRQLGHSRVDTTMSYVSVQDNDLANAHDRYGPLVNIKQGRS